MTPARIKGPLTNRPKVLIMINHEPAGGREWRDSAGLIGPKSGTSKALTTAP
jgi:hypothetical protein